jgi:hypothetical protein
MKKLLIVLIGLFLSFTCFSQSCLPDGITFTTQSQIDSFQVDYPGCSEIQGNVWINGSNINNLNGLIVLTSIWGGLYIQDNDSLVILTGLDNLNFIGGGLGVWDNEVLINLSGLENLDSIGDGLGININSSLENLSGLNNVTSIGDGIEIAFNYALNDLSGLESLACVGSNVSITGNLSLTTLLGLDNLTCIGGGVAIYSNPALTNLNSLESLTSVGGNSEEAYLSIYDNPFLVSIEGLNNLDPNSIKDLVLYDNPVLTFCNAQSVCNYLLNPNGIVIIYGNGDGCNNPYQITNVCGITLSCLPFGDYYLSSQNEIDSFQVIYPSCVDLQGNVTIEGTDITNLNGLSAIHSISKNLEIRVNDSLLSLGGLINLTSVQGKLIVRYNSLLESLSGLDNIEANSITALWIHNNSSLSTCEIKTVCDYLSSPNGYADIWSNATGCDSENEILFACGVGFEEKGKLASHIIIYPNPASNIITIETTELLNKGVLTILNLNGQELDYHFIMEPKTVIDISHLAAGVYFVKLTFVNDVRMLKVVKY